LPCPALYEQGADEFRIGDYVRRWCKWAMAGITLTNEMRRVGKY